MGHNNRLTFCQFVDLLYANIILLLLICPHLFSSQMSSLSKSILNLLVKNLFLSYNQTNKHTHCLFSSSSCRFVSYEAQQWLWNPVMRKAEEVRHVCGGIQPQLVQQMFLWNLLSHSHTCSSCWCFSVKTQCGLCFFLFLF